MRTNVQNVRSLAASVKPEWGCLLGIGWTKVAWLPWMWKGTPGLVVPVTGVGVIWGSKEDLEQSLPLYLQHSEISRSLCGCVWVGSGEGGKVTSAECERSVWFGNSLLGPL